MEWLWSLLRETAKHDQYIILEKIISLSCFLKRTEQLLPKSFNYLDPKSQELLLEHYGEGQSKQCGSFLLWPSEKTIFLSEPEERL